MDISCVILTLFWPFKTIWNLKHFSSANHGGRHRTPPLFQNLWIRPWFQPTCVIKRRLPDFHINEVKYFEKTFKKLWPKYIKFKSYKHFLNGAFLEHLLRKLSKVYFFHGHLQFTGQQGKGGDLFYSTLPLSPDRKKEIYIYIYIYFVNNGNSL